MSPEEKRLTVSARVTMTVEVNCPSNWGPETQMTQIQKQAVSEAVDIVKHAYSKDGPDSRIRIIGEPSTTAVLVKWPS